MQHLFHTIRPGLSGSFSVQLQSLKTDLRAWMTAHGLTPAHLVQARAYLTDAANQLPLLLEHPLYTFYLSAGAFSYVEQPLLDGAKIALQLWLVTDGSVRKTGTPECRTVSLGEVTVCFQSVRLTEEEARGKDAREQTREAFCRHIDWLGRKGLTLEANCHRTWLYVRDIDRHYAGVVAGRNDIFARQGLTADTHYIASTGIGGCGDNREAVVGVDFLSFDGLGDKDVRYLHAPDYLNPTHEYGVAFERATAIRLPDGATMTFISGTASIDKHGNCLFRGDVMTQLGRLFLNITKLLEQAGQTLHDMQYAIVYLRDVADYEAVGDYMRLRFPHLPVLVTEARVCRPEWLVEVECVALR